jgi:hypothetical protein
MQVLDHPGIYNPSLDVGGIRLICIFILCTIIIQTGPHESPQACPDYPTLVKKNMRDWTILGIVGIRCARAQVIDMKVMTDFNVFLSSNQLPCFVVEAFLLQMVSIRMAVGHHSTKTAMKGTGVAWIFFQADPASIAPYFGTWGHVFSRGTKKRLPSCFCGFGSGRFIIGKAHGRQRTIFKLADWSEAPSTDLTGVGWADVCFALDDGFDLDRCAFIVAESNIIAESNVASACYRITHLDLGC